MPEQMFSDLAQQLLFRLSDEELAYIPATGPGWTVRLADVAYVNSTMTPHGVGEITLHSRGDDLLAIVPQFEQIDRLYVALVRHLASRPFFRPVQAQLPSQAPLLERVLWLAAHVDAEEGAWISLMVAGSAVAAAGETGLVFMPSGDRRAHRIPWIDLCGIEARVPSPFVPAPATRFMGPGYHLDLPGYDAAFAALCSRYLGGDPDNCRVAGIRAFDPAIAASFSWELERARDDGLLSPEELFVACAFGRARNTLQSAIGRGEGGARNGMRNGNGHPRGPTDAHARTDLLLTDHRILRVDRRIETGAVLGTEQIPVSTRPQPRRSGPVLFLGDFELETDPAQAFDMPAVFTETYRAWALSEIPDPFTSSAGGG